MKKKATKKVKITEEYLVKLFRRRIEKGIKFLDDKLGRSVWLSRIEAMKLDLGQGDVCICGQAFVEGWDGTVQTYFDGEYDKAAPYGFFIEDEIAELPKWSDKGYDLLSYLWAKKLVALKFKNGFKI